MRSFALERQIRKTRVRCWNVESVEMIFHTKLFSDFIFQESCPSWTLLIISAVISYLAPRHICLTISSQLSQSRKFRTTFQFTHIVCVDMLCSVLFRKFQHCSKFKMKLESSMCLWLVEVHVRQVCIAVNAAPYQNEINFFCYETCFPCLCLFSIYKLFQFGPRQLLGYWKQVQL